MPRVISSGVGRWGEQGARSCGRHDWNTPAFNRRKQAADRSVRPGLGWHLGVWEVVAISAARGPRAEAARPRRIGAERSARVHCPAGRIGEHVPERGRGAGRGARGVLWRDYWMPQHADADVQNRLPATLLKKIENV